MKKAHKYRPDDFKRKILQTNISRELLLDEEYNWLSQIKPEELGKRYYNLKQHKWGHWHTDTNTSLTIKQKLSARLKELHKDPVYREKYLLAMKNKLKPTKENLQKLHASNVGKKRTDAQKEYMKSRSPKGADHRLFGQTLPEETKDKIRQKLIGDKNPFYGKSHPPELQERIAMNISKSKKGKTPKNIGVITSLWWNNGITNKINPICPGSAWTRGQLR